MKMSMEHWWNDIDRGKPKYSEEKPVPMPLCPPQISHVLAWDRTLGSVMRSLSHGTAKYQVNPNFI
jgi:hypothetical protein